MQCVCQMPTCNFVNHTLILKSLQRNAFIKGQSTAQRPGQTYVGVAVECEGPSMGSSLILFLFNPFFFAIKSSSSGSCFTDSLNHKKMRGQSLSIYNIKLNE